MKILIFCLPGIGDTLMFTPALELLRKKFPQTQIDCLTMFEGSKEVLLNNKSLDNVFYFPLIDKPKIEGIRYLLNLRKRKYDISIMAFPAYRKEYNFVSFLVGAKKRIAHKFKKGYFKELTFLNNCLVGVDEEKHNIINNLNLLKALNIKWEKEIDLNNIKYHLKLSEQDLDYIDKFLKEQEIDKRSLLIGIHPGSINSRIGFLRRWMPERYAEVADEFVNKYQAKIFVFAGPTDIKDAEEIKYLMKNKPIIIKGLNLGKVMAFIKNLDLLIANDSGLGHIAAALDITLVTLWGPTNPKWSLPWNKEKVYLIRKAKFLPWYNYYLKTKVPKGKEKLSGMEEIQVEDVLKTVENIIRQIKNK